jgi:hypothetical protein
VIGRTVARPDASRVAGRIVTTTLINTMRLSDGGVIVEIHGEIDMVSRRAAGESRAIPWSDAIA